VFVATGLAILAGRRARAAATVAGALIFLWALLRHLPVVAASPFLSADWTKAGKAAWFVGGSLTVAATFPTIGNDRTWFVRRLLNREREFVVAGRITLGLFQILTGVQHFKFTAFVASLIPPWFPGDAVFWTYFGGVALIAGGIGLLIPRTARWAALLSGVMIFSWFFIVHVSREIARVADGIAVFEALGAAGVLLVIAGLRSPQQVGPAAFTPGRAAARPRPRGTR
jgi:uncharacterized membrane protein YphA (DoxX/SURF4 family)